MIVAGLGLALAPGIRFIVDYAIGFAFFVLAGIFGAAAFVAAIIHQAVR